MATREILTIQLGHYANFVGTHWWNLQETNFSYDPQNPSEFNPEVLYRVADVGNKVTSTPRLLLADLKGTLGYLSEEGNYSELVQANVNQEPEILWEENRLETTVQPPAQKSAFVKSLESGESNEGVEFDFENETKSWVDYLIPRFHSRTVNVITEYEHGSTSQPFDLFPYGQSLWKRSAFSEDFADKIRVYVEECDLMQGFQVLFDTDDGFSGLGAACIQHLRDEYGKSILTWPVLDSTPREKSISDYAKAINTVLCWHNIGENTSLFSPLSCGTNGWLTPGKPRAVENITYRSDLRYHTSALLATALDTLSLRYRHKKYTMSALSDLCADLNKLGRKAVATSLSLPFPMVEKQDLIDMLDDLDGGCPWVSLTPSCNIGMDNAMQSLALRGVPESRLKRPMQEAQDQMIKPAYKCSSVHEMLSLYINCSWYSTGTYLTTAEQPLKIKDPYPKIFNSNILENGDSSRNKSRESNVNSVPVMAGLHSGNFMAKMYESLHDQVKKVRSLNKFHAFVDSGIEQDEFMESVHNLLDCKESYEDHDA
ncbi:protein misato [Nasonia vitripennis]|uniref:Protein misato n=1 Tax=Nasonia vitripennis TaxID=7425 RepID=A0A7M7G854_NASVI|nr:protein misato [Nasonia vitripennis]